METAARVDLLRDLLDGPRQVSLAPRTHLNLIPKSTTRRLVRSLPGSVAERQLLESFSHMLPELLRFSSASHLLSKIPEELQAHHRVVASAAPAGGGAVPSRALGRAGRLLQSHADKAKSAAPREVPDIWAGWATAQPTETMPFDASDDDDLDLDGLGL